MRVERQDVEGTAVVTIAEPVEVDMGNAEAFKKAAAEAIGSATRVVLDASLVEFFDSAGMSALLSLKKRVAASGGRFVLAGLDRAVVEIFRMVGLDAVFETFPDVPQALAALRE